MTIDAEILAIATVLSAVLGGILTATIPHVISVLKERRRRGTQKYKLMYVKMYHLRSQVEGKPPAYRKRISRLAKEVDVFDEFHCYRLNILHQSEPDFQVGDRTSGTVDMLILHPWQELSFPDREAETLEKHLAQVLTQNSDIFFTRSVYYNAFQRGHEYYSMRMEQDTDEARLLVDFSTLPNFEHIVRGTPQSLVDNGRSTRGIGTIELQRGIYMATGTNLKKDSVMRIDFVIDWNVVDKREDVPS